MSSRAEIDNDIAETVFDAHVRVCGRCFAASVGRSSGLAHLCHAGSVLYMNWQRADAVVQSERQHRLERLAKRNNAKPNLGSAHTGEMF